ncbi:MAG: hypothetical protein U9Q63_01550 [Patescibacteria group bacterium]|nr:hypothetical protein [Patescibacteria group bacterium]
MSTGKKRLLAYLFLGLSLIISIKLIKDIIKLWNSDDRLLMAGKELEISKQELENLKLKLNETETDEWWEKQVRNTLKMAREGEEVVIVPEGLIASSSTLRIETEEKVKEKPSYQKWWKLFVY